MGMNQAEVHKLISALKFKVSPRPYRLHNRNRGAYQSMVGASADRYRLEICRSAVTSLIVDERLEMVTWAGITIREYTERLIQEAITHGETHVPTMQMADWWLQDKSAIHKLFKVVVEILGHPFPPLRYSNTEPNKKMIHNVLLSEARREMRLQKEFERRTEAETKNLENEID